MGVADCYQDHHTRVRCRNQRGRSGEGDVDANVSVSIAGDSTFTLLLSVSGKTKKKVWISGGEWGYLTLVRFFPCFHAPRAPRHLGLRASLALCSFSSTLTLFATVLLCSPVCALQLTTWSLLFPGLEWLFLFLFLFLFLEATGTDHRKGHIQITRFEFIATEEEYKKIIQRRYRFLYV